MMSRIIFFSAALLFSFGVVFPAVASEDKDVVAHVGGIPITRLDVAREAEEILPLFGGLHKGVSKEKRDEAREKALQILIEQALKVSYAREHNISVADATSVP